MGGDLLGRFNEYCLKQLPRLLKTKLEREVEKQVRDRIITVWRECQESLLISFQQMESSLQDPEDESTSCEAHHHDPFDFFPPDDIWSNLVNMDEAAEHFGGFA